MTVMASWSNEDCLLALADLDRTEFIMVSVSGEKLTLTSLELLKAFIAFGESYYCSLATKQGEDELGLVWEEFRTAIEELDELEAVTASPTACRLLSVLANDIRNRESLATLGWEIERLANVFLTLH